MRLNNSTVLSEGTRNDLIKSTAFVEKVLLAGVEAATYEFPTVFRARAAENGETFPEATHAP